MLLLCSRRSSSSRSTIPQTALLSSWGFALFLPNRARGAQQPPRRFPSENVPHPSARASRLRPGLRSNPWRSQQSSTSGPPPRPPSALCNPPSSTPVQPAAPLPDPVSDSPLGTLPHRTLGWVSPDRPHSVSLLAFLAAGIERSRPARQPLRI